MSRSAVWLFALATGCSFQHGAAPNGADGAAGADAARAGDAKPPPDAFVFQDAKVYQDGPPAVPGSLVVTPVVLPDQDISLTNEGTTDWAHWGFNGGGNFDHKADVTQMISDVTAVGANRFGVGNVALTASWSDGTPDGSATRTGTGTGTTFPGGLQLTVPAGVTPHTLRLYVGAKNSSARLTASLSDSSASAVTDDQSAGSATHYQYTIVYNAATDGQTLTVTWTDRGDGVQGFDMLLSATLQ